MTDFNPDQPNINQVPDCPMFVLCEDYVVNCVEFAKKWIDHLSSVIEDEKRDNPMNKRKHPTKCDYFDNYTRDGTIVIPKGFEFDGASIPEWADRVPDFIFRYRSADQRLHMAALAHDWLYHTHKFTKDATDDLLFYMAKECGATRNEAWFIWDACQNHGSKSWKNTRKDCAYIKELCMEIASRFENDENIEGKLRQYTFPEDLIKLID